MLSGGGINQVWHFVRHFVTGELSEHYVPWCLKYLNYCLWINFVRTWTWTRLSGHWSLLQVALKIDIYIIICIVMYVLIYLYRSGRGWYWLADNMWTHQKDLVHRFSRPTVKRRHSIETALVRVVDDLNTCMESGSKSVLLSLDSISAAFDTIDTVTVWAGISLVSIVPHRHRGSQVWHLELRFWRSSEKRPGTCPLLLRISHLKDHGVSRDQVSSIRGRYSTLHGCSLPGSIPNGGSITMCVGFDVLAPRQLNSGKSYAMILSSSKLGSYQAGARRFVGHWR